LQPRKVFNGEAIQELANSIKQHGILQPLVVVRDGDKFKIVAGERRFRAATLLGLESVPAIVRDFDDQMRLEVALIENVQREDLSLLEMATAYHKLTEQFNIELNDISKRIGKAPSTISNIKRLLHLPKAAKKALNELKITETHARAILALDGNSEKQQELLDHIIKHKWTATRAEQFVTAVKNGAATPTDAVSRTADTNEQTEAIAKKLKAPVKMRRLAKGGRLTITFTDDDDYERLTKLLS
jgi:ParB family chromosome partitioning protein